MICGWRWAVNTRQLEFTHKWFVKSKGMARDDYRRFPVVSTPQLHVSREETAFEQCRSPCPGLAANPSDLTFQLMGKLQSPMMLRLVIGCGVLRGTWQPWSLGSGNRRKV